MADPIDLRQEAAFLVGVALDTLDQRTLIEALEYRHGRKLSPGHVRAVRAEYARLSGYLPVAMKKLSPLPYTPND